MNDSWFVEEVPHERAHTITQPEKDERKGADGKDLNPDRSDTSPLPGTVTSYEQANGKTDEQLLSAYRSGDKASFSNLVTRYQRELYHFLVRFLGDRAAAEDVFQEAFLQVHQSADQFDPSRRFRPWLFTIAANKARDLMRSNARRPTNPLHASINSGDDDSGEFLDLMSSAPSVAVRGTA